MNSLLKVTCAFLYQVKYKSPSRLENKIYSFDQLVLARYFFPCRISLLVKMDGEDFVEEKLLVSGIFSSSLSKGIDNFV